MSKIVLDSSALLAAVNGEPGAEIVTASTDDFLVCAVNWAEAVARLVGRGQSREAARAALSYVDAEIVPFNRALAEEAGGLIALTKVHGRSLGVRACLALALREKLPVLTADPVLADVDLVIEIRVIR